jgi:two-component system sensor histidine kinase/response regulator
MPTAVQELMSSPPVTCLADATLAEATALMHARQIGSVVVTRGDLVVGILTERDLLRAAAGAADPTTEPTVLFLLSSSGDRLGAAERHLHGFAASLTKPVRSSELFDCLVDHLTDAGDQGAVGETIGASAQSSHPEGDEASEGETNWPRGTVLLVDDNATNRLVGSKVLAKLGYRFDVANHGGEALQAMAARHYDAVLMDCQMPEMDGYEATAEIRRLEGAGRHTPIIAMTAAAMAGDRETCLAAGMDDYITKPVRTETVAAVLERWVSAHPVAADPVAAAPDVVSPTPEESAGAALDPAQVELLRSLDDGDGSLLGEIIEQYLAQTTEGRAELEHHLADGDAEAFGRVAHTLKGASANVGATVLSVVCGEMESLGKATPLGDVGALVERFDAEFARVRDALTVLRREDLRCAS